MYMRLDRYLAEMGIGTRSQVKQYIKKKVVTVNGTVIAKPDYKVVLDEDKIAVQGKELQYQKYKYYMLHKPQGCVSATADGREKTVMDYLEDTKKDLFPVGRLDKDTEGLLLITNDGQLAHNLLSPKKHIPKKYYAKVEGSVGEADIAQFKTGIDIGDEKPALPAELCILKSEEISEVEVTIYEGRFHQVKRMFLSVGKKVIYLKRIAMGSLVLDPELEIGQVRELSDGELKLLNKDLR